MLEIPFHGALRCFKGKGRRPFSLADSPDGSFPWKAKNCDPFKQCLGFASVGDKPRGSAIAKLLGDRGPMAIFGRVVSVVVDAVKRVSRRWARTNVCQEVFKLFPALAKFDAAPTVVKILRIVWVLAARVNISPAGIFGRSRHTMFSSGASTTLCVSTVQAASGHSDGIPALASAFPPAPTFGVRSDQGNNRQPSIRLSYKINSCVHGYPVSFYCHCSTEVKGV